MGAKAANRIRSHGHERQNAQQGEQHSREQEESPLTIREKRRESQFIFVLNEAGVSSNGDSLFSTTHHPWELLRRVSAVPQVGHHVAHVAGREGGAEHRVAGDVFEDLGTRHELQVGGVDVGSRGWGDGSISGSAPPCSCSR